MRIHHCACAVMRVVSSSIGMQTVLHVWYILSTSLLLGLNCCHHHLQTSVTAMHLHPPARSTTVDFVQ